MSKKDKKSKSKTGSVGSKARQFEANDKAVKKESTKQQKDLGKPKQKSITARTAFSPFYGSNSSRGPEAVNAPQTTITTASKSPVNSSSSSKSLFCSSMILSLLSEIFSLVADCGTNCDSKDIFCASCGSKVKGGGTPVLKTSPVVSHSTTTAVRPQKVDKYRVDSGNAISQQTSVNGQKNDGKTGGIAKSDFTVTYGKQPDWAYSEQQKNTTGQYKTGQFRHANY